MADYQNPNMSNLPHDPVLSDDPSLDLFFNSFYGPLINPSPDFCQLSYNPGINIGQDKVQGHSSRSDCLVNVVENFSGSRDGVDKKGKGKVERCARKQILDKARKERLNKGQSLLRSVLPKIESSKCQRNKASDLAKAIEYVKELKQSIHNLEIELQSLPSSTNSPLPIDMWTMKQTSLFSSVPKFDRDQPKVEVETDDNGNVNVNMFCESRPDLLCTVMYALDLLKIDVQQATATCFNGFKLDIFQAKQCKDGQLWKAEDIKSVLMLCAYGHDQE